MARDMSLLLLLVVPFVGSAVAALLPTNARNLESSWAAAVALAVAVPLALLYREVAGGGVVSERLAWLPSLGVDIVVRIDGFAWMFAMLVSGMGLLVVVYARYYLSPDDPAARFYSLLLGFMGAMLGVVVSGNLVQLVVFWELTSVFSFLLIGYWTHRKDARRGARMAFTVTAGGGLALLAGVLLLGLLAWPGMPLEWKMFAVVHGVCAQAHTVDMAGLRLPLCARNTGIYSGFLISIVYLLALGRARAAKLPPWPILITLLVFVLIMAFDGFNSMLVDLFMPHLYTPRNELRTLTGIGMGVAMAVLLFLILNISLRSNANTEQRVIGTWLELGGALLINLLVLAAMYGNVGLMFWPIAISAWLGITGVLYCVNLLLTALFMRYEGAVTRPRSA